MKLRLLISFTATLCGLFSATAQPAAGRHTSRPGVYAITPQTTLSYESGLAPLADYLRSYIDLGTTGERMSADRAIVLSTDTALGRDVLHGSELVAKR